ncbi:ribonuclease III [Candidatus Cardinium hertigii]|jgi:ribonuclease-3|uniref:Ribonuclease 3 n=1 Tax=Candidatus Cardinium hertigii TaxID=247481 RepID=A0A3N2QCY0_9BACT|nr:ribonuclease III [Candidatus Cardinium hertigii]ROT47645.1 ribonuclease III [Candidatus Cardinium hertigii]
MGRFLALLHYFFIKQDPATQQLITFVRATTGMIPLNLALYKIAIQHSSIEEGYTSNERLEFLGDAVLSLIAGEYLFKRYPLKEEGFLTDIRSRLVNRDSLNKLARKIHLDKLLHYDTNLIKRSGSKSIYGNALEAFIGAVYLDHGYACCRRFVIDRLIGNHISLENLIENDTNFKSRIIQWAHKHHLQVVFKILIEKQYEDYKEFTAQVLIGEKIIGEGTGRTKKCAEQMAAQQALQYAKEIEQESLMVL